MSSRVEIGSVTDPADLNRLIGTSPVDMVYSDPPWGPGNVRYWSTMNRMELPPWPELLSALVAVARRCRGPVFYEQGLRFADKLVDAMRAGNHTLTARWTTAYGHPKRPAVLLLFNSRPPPSLDLSGLGGVRLVTTALHPWARPGATVLDPCAGLGTTCAAGRRLGLQVLGLEASPERAARARARL